MRPGTRRSASGARRANDVRQALDALRRIVQALRIAGRQAERHGLGGAQLFVLRQIAEHPGASVNEVAALTFTHQSTVSVLIQHLVRRRLVTRTEAPSDRRRQCLALTAKGRAFVRRTPAAIQDQLIAALASVPAPDRRALARSLAAIAERLTPAQAMTRKAPLLFGR